MQVLTGGTVSRLLKDVPLPRMFHAEQTFSNEEILPVELPGVVHRELSQPHLSKRIAPGMRIAITAGSRGIRNIDRIVKSIVEFVQSQGAHPFIVPAMGSHGGAHAEGQREVLESLGISEGSMGCPILSSMEVVELGHSELGNRVVIDRNAAEADGIIVACRVKPHNAFRGPYESGICKMMAVGLGKQVGAEQAHSGGMGQIGAYIPAMAKVMLEKASILFAVACIENAYDKTCQIEAVAAEDILNREPELLKLAFQNMPRLLVEECDVLAVHEIGKNYSGTGVDPNITGTFSTAFASGGIKVQRTCFLNLSPESHGNALGVGLSNAITRKIFDAIDPEKMYPNCITSTVLASARIPCVMATDKEAIQLCIRTCTGLAQGQIRLVCIANSLHIDRILLSEAYYEEVSAGRYPGLAAVDTPVELQFDAADNLITPIRAFV